jgi:hypothetical protein
MTSMRTTKAGNQIVNLRVSRAQLQRIAHALECHYEAELENMSVGFEERPEFEYPEDKAQWNEARKCYALALRIRRNY